MEQLQYTCAKHQIKCRMICLNKECESVFDTNRLICDECFFEGPHQTHQIMLIQQAHQKLVNLAKNYQSEFEKLGDFSDLQQLLKTEIQTKRKQINQLLDDVELQMVASIKLPENQRKFAELLETLKFCTSPSLFKTDKLYGQSVLRQMLSEKNNYFQRVVDEVQLKRQECTNYVENFLKINLLNSTEIMQENLLFQVPNFSDNIKTIFDLAYGNPAPIETNTCTQHHCQILFYCIDPLCQQKETEICLSCMEKNFHKDCQQQKFETCDARIQTIIEDLVKKENQIQDFKSESFEIRNYIAQIKLEVPRIIRSMEKSLLDLMKNGDQEASLINLVASFQKNLIDEQKLLQSGSSHELNKILRQILTNQENPIHDAILKIEQIQSNKIELINLSQKNFLEYCLDTFKLKVNNTQDIYVQLQQYLDHEQKNQENMNKMILNIIKNSEIKLKIDKSNVELKDLVWVRFQKEGLIYFENFDQVFDSIDQVGLENYSKITKKFIQSKSVDNLKLSQKEINDLFIRLLKGNQIESGKQTGKTLSEFSIDKFQRTGLNFLRNFENQFADLSTILPSNLQSFFSRFINSYQFQNDIFQKGIIVDVAILKFKKEGIQFFNNIHQVIQLLAEIKQKQSNPDTFFYLLKSIQSRFVEDHNTDYWNEAIANLTFRNAHYSHSFETQADCRQMLRFDEQHFICVDKVEKSHYIQLINLQTMKEQRSLQVHDHHFKKDCLAIIGGGLVALISFDGKIKIIDIMKTHINQELEATNSDENSQGIYYMPQSQVFCTQATQKPYRLIQVYHRNGDKFKRHDQMFTSYHTNEITKVVEIQMNQIASVSNDKCIQFWDLSNMTELCCLTEEQAGKDIQVLTPDTVIVSCYGGYFSIWDYKQKQRIQKVEVGNGSVVLEIEIINQDYLLLINPDIVPNIQIRRRKDDWNQIIEINQNVCHQQTLITRVINHRQGFILFYNLGEGITLFRFPYLNFIQRSFN